MIQEFRILFRVQHLQKGRCRISLIGGPDLVHLIEHDHRIGCLRVLEGLDQFAGQGPHIGSAVSLDLGLIPHTP